MAQWSEKKTNPQDLNNGNEYTTADNITIESLNYANNNAFWATKFLQQLVSEIDTSEANLVGDVLVEFVEEDGKTIFKFSNLKGQNGSQGPQGTIVTLYSAYESTRTYRNDNNNLDLLTVGKSTYAPKNSSVTGNEPPSDLWNVFAQGGADGLGGNLTINNIDDIEPNVKYYLKSTLITENSIEAKLEKVDNEVSQQMLIDTNITCDDGTGSQYEIIDSSLATVNKVGGYTEKSLNKLEILSIDSYSPNGVTCEIVDNSTIILNGIVDTANAECIFNIPQIDYTNGATLRIEFLSGDYEINGSSTLDFSLMQNSNWNSRILIHTNTTDRVFIASNPSITSNDNDWILLVNFGSLNQGNVFNNLKLRVSAYTKVYNVNTIPSFETYYEGFKSSLPFELKSIGNNWLPISEQDNSTYGGITFTNLKNGGWKLNGTSTIAYPSKYIFNATGGDFTGDVSFVNNLRGKQIRMGLFLVNPNNLRFTFKISYPNNFGGAVSSYVITTTNGLYSNLSTIIPNAPFTNMLIQSEDNPIGSNFDGVEIYPMILSANYTPTQFEPYTTSNFINKYQDERLKYNWGDNVRNYVNPQTGLMEIGNGVIVFDGTESIAYDITNGRFIVPNIYGYFNPSVINTYTNYYNDYSWENRNLNVNGVFPIFDVGGIIIKDSNYTSAETFKQHLAQLYSDGNPLTLIYQLAIPMAEQLNISEDFSFIAYNEGLLTSVPKGYYGIDFNGDGTKQNEVNADNIRLLKAEIAEQQSEINTLQNTLNNLFAEQQVIVVGNTSSIADAYDNKYTYSATENIGQFRQDFSYISLPIGVSVSYDYETGDVSIGYRGLVANQSITTTLKYYKIK